MSRICTGGGPVMTIFRMELGYVIARMGCPNLLYLCRGGGDGGGAGLVMLVSCAKGECHEPYDFRYCDS
jgi:hypothetical protein